jgi:hypothetical protein
MITRCILNILIIEFFLYVGYILVRDLEIHEGNVRLLLSVSLLLSIIIIGISVRRIYKIHLIIKSRGVTDDTQTYR